MEMPEGSPFADEDVLNILLISTDERTDAVNDWDAFTHLNELDGTKATTEFSSDARADSLILCSLNIKDDTIKLVSIERATGVPILLDGYEGQYDWITHTFPLRRCPPDDGYGGKLLQTCRWTTMCGSILTPLFRLWMPWGAST